MFRKIQHSAVVLGLLVPLATQANQCRNPHASEEALAVCDVTYSVIPTFADLCVADTEIRQYTITNNTPATVKINYIRIKNNDIMPDAASSIGIAPTNNCGSSLASGASCNIQLNLLPLQLGTFNRVLQVGIDTRQIEIDAPTIMAAINCLPPAPPAPPVPIDGFSPVPFPAALVNAAIIGAAGVTNTGISAINGDVDASPTPAITGFPPGTIVPPFTTHPNDATAIAAKAAADTYFLALNALACTYNGLPIAELSTLNVGSGPGIFPPGVYCFPTSAHIATTISLTGGPTSSYTFRTGTSLVTATGSSVLLTGGVSKGNVNWAVGSAATLGTSSILQGNIAAGTAVTLNTGASLLGRAWALTASVTLDTNPVNPG